MPPTEKNNLDVRLIEITSKIEVLLEKQEEMAENISKIKEAIYDPDQGLYARLRELESWKATYSRLVWIIMTALVALTTSAFWNILTSP